MPQPQKISDLTIKYIKYLLAKTPLPLFPTIEHGQYMVKGVHYIYKDKVLLCTESGTFLVTKDFDVELDYLRVNNLLTVMPEDRQDAIYLYENQFDTNPKASPLVTTDKLISINNYKKEAKFKLKDNFFFGQERLGVTQTFVSNSTLYDNNTHKFLGTYLRLLRNQYGLDLMSLYNCYNEFIVYDISLDRHRNKVNDTGIRNKQVLLVPIKFNTTYTIAFECHLPILVKSIFYNNGLVLNSRSTNTYLSYKLNDEVKQINYCSFNQPFTISLLNDDKELQSYEDCLYLAIQVPRGHTSTLTVLEGDYTSDCTHRISDIRCLRKKYDVLRMSKLLYSKPSLLSENDNKQHPFADKLISYLLRNTIDTREYIDDNVANVEKTIHYYPPYQGQWDIQLRYILFKRYMRICDKYGLNKEDILGYVDNDIEDAIRKGYMLDVKKNV